MKDQSGDNFSEAGHSEASCVEGWLATSTHRSPAEVRGTSRPGRGRGNCKYVSGQGRSKSSRRVSLLVELISTKDSGFIVIYAHVMTVISIGHFCDLLQHLAWIEL